LPPPVAGNIFKGTKAALATSKSTLVDDQSSLTLDTGPASAQTAFVTAQGGFFAKVDYLHQTVSSPHSGQQSKDSALLKSLRE